MTDTKTAAKSAVPAGSLHSLFDKVQETAAKNPAAERLLEELQSFLAAQAERAISSVGHRAGELTSKLTDVAEGNANPGSVLGKAAKELVSGASPGKAIAKGGLKSLGEKVKGLFGGGGSGGGKSTNIIEDIEVGVPVAVAYNQWTSLEEFPKWSKGAQSVSADDPVESKWKAKICWSNRNWNAKVTEQLPDRRIAWTADGPKGVVSGAVTFHPMGENLTKILVVLDYTPSGFFEKTANLWRAPGRRARLDLKLFRRYVMTNADAGEEGWRGEIRDSEVVREPDEVEADEKEAKRSGEEERAEEEEEPEYDEDEEPDEEEEEDEEPDEDEDYYDEDEEPEADYEEEDRRRRRPATVR